MEEDARIAALLTRDVKAVGREQKAARRRARGVAARQFTTIEGECAVTSTGGLVEIAGVKREGGTVIFSPGAGGAFVRKRVAANC
jgi:hypothetical protein